MPRTRSAVGDQARHLGPCGRISELLGKLPDATPHASVVLCDPHKGLGLQGRVGQNPSLPTGLLSAAKGRESLRWEVVCAHWRNLSLEAPRFLKVHKGRVVPPCKVHFCRSESGPSAGRLVWQTHCEDNGTAGEGWDLVVRSVPQGGTFLQGFQIHCCSLGVGG